MLLRVGAWYNEPCRMDGVIEKMPRIERIKAEISFHEKMFFAALAVILALVGWAAEHYLTVSFWILLLCALGFFCSLVFALWSYKQIKRLLEDLENE
ncbi:hypothetical protein [Methyloglobulus sp.]|uniref:hypothetical protein n=1 Tax=Methyloglobulus sp. TaxID=2518622 RepID=UPI0032B78059